MITNNTVEKKQPHKKILQGVVVSAKNQKTIVVKVEKKLIHAFYKKLIIKHKKYHVHDKDSLAKEGNIVKIISCRPISALKKWCLLEIINK